jgi:hypothetical protein
MIGTSSFLESLNYVTMLYIGGLSSSKTEQDLNIEDDIEIERRQRAMSQKKEK